MEQTHFWLNLIFLLFQRISSQSRKWQKWKINGDLKRQLQWKINMFGALFANASKSSRIGTLWRTCCLDQFHAMGSRRASYKIKLYRYLARWRFWWAYLCQLDLYILTLSFCGNYIWRETASHTMTELLSAQPPLPCQWYSWELLCCHFKFSFIFTKSRRWLVCREDTKALHKNGILWSP